MCPRNSVGATELGDDYADLPNKVVHSGAFLIDITDRDNPHYTNLTQAIEDWLVEQGEPAEHLISAHATCANEVGAGVPWRVAVWTGR